MEFNTIVKPNKKDLRYYHTINTQSQFVFDVDLYIQDLEEYCEQRDAEMESHEYCTVGEFEKLEDEFSYLQEQYDELKKNYVLYLMLNLHGRI